MLGRVKGEWGFAWIPKHVAKATKKISPGCEKVIIKLLLILLLLSSYFENKFRDTVMMLLALIDPSGSNCRIRHRLRRRVYHSEVGYYYITMIFLIIMINILGSELYVAL